MTQIWKLPDNTIYSLPKFRVVGTSEVAPEYDMFCASAFSNKIKKLICLGSNNFKQRIFFNNGLVASVKNSREEFLFTYSKDKRRVKVVCNLNDTLEKEQFFFYNNEFKIDSIIVVNYGRSIVNNVLLLKSSYGSTGLIQKTVLYIYLNEERTRLRDSFVVEDNEYDNDLEIRYWPNIHCFKFEKYPVYSTIQEDCNHHSQVFHFSKQKMKCTHRIHDKIMGMYSYYFESDSIKSFCKVQDTKLKGSHNEYWVSQCRRSYFQTNEVFFINSNYTYIDTSAGKSSDFINTQDERLCIRSDRYLMKLASSYTWIKGAEYNKPEDESLNILEYLFNRKNRLCNFYEGYTNKMKIRIKYY